MRISAGYSLLGKKWKLLEEIKIYRVEK